MEQERLDVEEPERSGEKRAYRQREKFPGSRGIERGEDGERERAGAGQHGGFQFRG